MADLADRLACPLCRSGLAPGDEHWSCLGCGTAFPALLGIPDLRVADDVFLANEADWGYALRLADDFDRLDFRGLLERYFDLSPEIPPDLRQRQIAHILTAPERANRWLDALGPASAGPLLDLGCGTGSFLAAAGRGIEEAWGLDIALRWLLVARKRLDEEGLYAIPLVCGCAERLPFVNGAFRAIVAGDAIEHVADQPATLAEAHRALRTGGRIFLASPNRFSLAPEPHVGVWGVGYLPRPWMAPYVRWRRRLDFRAIRTLGLSEWRRLLARSPFRGGEISAPGLPRADLRHFGPLKRGLAQVYNALVATAPGQALARRIGPLFHVVCTRPAAGSAPSALPTTRPRSTPPARQASTAGSR